MNYYSRNKDMILDKTYSFLDGLVGGTKISIRDLCEVLFPEKFDLDDFSVMCAITNDVFAGAAKHDLVLDTSEYKDCTVGTPYNIGFKVYHRKPGKQCPACGSRHTASILYGMPCHVDKLQDDERNHRIYLGGCCVMDWHDEYVDRNIIDGAGWDLEIYFDSLEPKKITGMNAYPGTWQKLLKSIDKIELLAGLL